MSLTLSGCLLTEERLPGTLALSAEPELIGHWSSTEKGILHSYLSIAYTGKDPFLSAVRSNDRTFTADDIHTAKQQEGTTVYQAYLSRVQGWAFASLGLRPNDANAKYMIVRYQVLGDNLTVWEIKDTSIVTAAVKGIIKTRPGAERSIVVTSSSKGLEDWIMNLKPHDFKVSEIYERYIPESK